MSCTYVVAKKFKRKQIYLIIIEIISFDMKLEKIEKSN